jgi:type VI secretion system protein ImpK
MYQPSIIITSFEEFAIKIFDKIEQIKRGIVFSAATTIDEQNKIIAQYQNELSNFIRDQDAIITAQNGKLASEAFKEVIYIMTALADEMFLSFEWIGKTYWRQHSLEQNFFGTNQAGERLLANINNFMKTKENNNKEIGIAYLYALSLGFKGKLRYGTNFNETCITLKEQLFNMIYHKSPTLYKTEQSLLRQTQENVIIEKLEFRKFTIYNWKNVIISSALIYLLCGYFIWHAHTISIWKSLEIQQAKEKK